MLDLDNTLIFRYHCQSFFLLGQHCSRKEQKYSGNKNDCDKINFIHTFLL
jgi:hypothetical protein